MTLPAPRLLLILALLWLSLPLLCSDSVPLPSGHASCPLRLASRNSTLQDYEL